MELNGSHVLITGASRGIGAKMAREYAKRGATVSLAARSAEPLKLLADELDGHAFPVDLLNRDDVDELIARVEHEVRPVDVLVNNAGLETNAIFHTVEAQQIRDVATLNLEAPMVLTRAVLPGMIDRNKGHLFFTSSIAGTAGFPGLAAYSATKAGLTNFAATLRMELKDTAIHTSVIAPGPVDTNMWDHLEHADELSDMLKRLRRFQLIPVMKPEKIAKLSVDAVEKNKPYVGLPKRLGVNHVLRNTPSAITSLILKGVKLGPQADES